MYAAVKAGPKGLLISNDEMRDHMFQLLAPRFVHKWKQRHQASGISFAACMHVHCLLKSDVTACMRSSTCSCLSGSSVQSCCYIAWQWQHGNHVTVCASMYWLLGEWYAVHHPITQPDNQTMKEHGKPANTTCC